MREKIPAIACLVLISACGSGSDADNGENYFAPMVKTSDFAALTGDDWSGKLTYLNYAEPQKEVTIPAELAMAQNGNTFELYISYPDEPRADGRAELTVSEDGRMINDERVVDRIEQDGMLRLETQQDCQDDGEEALCEYTYMLAPEAFSLRKKVTLDGSGETFQCNKYSFTRQ